MIRFREKWLWAVCLAILVHVGFFFVFYMNVHKKESSLATNNRTNETTKSAKPTKLTDNNNKMPPNVAKTIAITTTKNTNDASQKPASKVVTTATAMSEAKTNPVSTRNARTQKTDNINQPADEASVVVSSNTRSLNVQPSNATPFGPTPSAQSDPASQADPIPSSPTSLNRSQTLDNLKAQAGLLSIDVPNKQPDTQNVTTDQAYLSAKSKVEDINSQLSAAINEVKKRNQQKIDNAQQLKNSASTTNGTNTVDKKDDKSASP